MADIPYTNTKNHAVHIGGKMIRSGETRMIDETLFDADTTDEVSDALLLLLDGTVSDVASGLATLQEDDLAALKEQELSGQNRKGVMEAIAAALLRVAAA